MGSFAWVTSSLWCDRSVCSLCHAIGPVIMVVIYVSATPKNCNVNYKTATKRSGAYFYLQPNINCSTTKSQGFLFKSVGDAGDTSLKASTFATDPSNRFNTKERAHMLRIEMGLDGHLWQAYDKLGRIISVVAVVQHCSKPVMMYAVFRWIE